MAKTRQQKEAEEARAQQTLNSIKEEVKSSNLSELDVSLLSSAQIVKMALVQSMLSRQLEIHGALYQVHKLQILRHTLEEVKNSFALVDEIFK